MIYYECKICNFKTSLLSDMKRHLERTYICKMEPNMYFQNTILEICRFCQPNL